MEPARDDTEFLQAWLDSGRPLSELPKRTYVTRTLVIRRRVT